MESEAIKLIGYSLWQRPVERETEFMSESKEHQERKSKQFWAVNDTWEVKFVTGYECSQDSELWWVPELGYTLSEKHHLFATAQEARARGIAELESKIDGLDRALGSLRTELALAEKES